MKDDEYLDKVDLRKCFNQITINAIYGQKMEKGLKVPEPVKEMLLLFWESSMARALIKTKHFKEVIVKESYADCEDERKN